MSSNAQPLQVLLLNDVTADETTSSAVDISSYASVVFYIIGKGVTSGGVITLEEAWYDPTVFNGDGGFGGTWSAIATVNASDVDGTKQLGYHLSVGAYKWVRARISTAITGGGTISVSLVATSN